MIEVQNISKSFRKDFWSPRFSALEDVSFNIKAGKIVGFLGANGAGKTTSMKIILGFIKPNSGKVIFSKELGTKREEILNNIGYMPERPYFYPYLTGRSFLKYIGELHGLHRNEIDKQTLKLAEKLSIEFALDRKIKAYSKGMLQRLGFASVLIHNPKVIILDEPLSGLDPIGRQDFKNIIIDLKNQNKTVFLSSHIVPDIEEVSDQVVFLEKGKLIYDGSLSDLMSQNIHKKYTFTVWNKNLDKREAKFRLLKEEGELSLLECDVSEKEEVLKSLMSKNVEIEKLEYNRATLEEVIYKVRNNDRI